MIYVILGIMLIAMALLSQTKESIRYAVMGIGAAIAVTFTMMALVCSSDGDFSKERSAVAYDLATYKGNGVYDTRSWGEIKVMVENKDKIPDKGQQVYIYRYYNDDETLDLLIAPWKLFRERWYI